MNWEQFIEWIKTRDFCKGNYQYPAYVYSYPDFVALGDYCFSVPAVTLPAKAELF